MYGGLLVKLSIESKATNHLNSGVINRSSWAKERSLENAMKYKEPIIKESVVRGNLILLKAFPHLLQLCHLNSSKL